jgi:hypothetical protein
MPTTNPPAPTSASFDHTNVTNSSPITPVSVEVTEALHMWQQTLEDFILEPEERDQLYITADSPHQGAVVFLSSLFATISEATAMSLPAGGSVQNFELRNLASRRYRFRMFAHSLLQH